MTNKPENPPAFPQSKPIYMAQDNGDGYVNPTVVGKSVTGGMTLRDYFAAAALPNHPCNCYEYANVANYCYALADAMLKARQS